MLSTIIHLWQIQKQNPEHTIIFKDKIHLTVQYPYQFKNRSWTTENSQVPTQHRLPGFLACLTKLCCCSSVIKPCLTLWEPVDCSTLGFPVLHYLPEFAQTHVYWVGDAIQPSHPLSSPLHPALDLSQHQDLFQWVGSSTSGGQSTGASVSASVLPMNIQGWFLLGWTCLTKH